MSTIDGQKPNPELQLRIVDAAKELFLEKGIKAVTMDEVARKLGISKRTLYQTIRDKEELILFCYETETRRQDLEAERMLCETDDVFDVLITGIERALSIVDSISRATIEEVIKFPRLRAAIEARRSYLRNRVVDFCQKGIAQGLLLPNMDYSLLFDIFNLLSDALHTGNLLEGQRPKKVFLHSVVVFLRGCCTEAGRARIDRFVELEGLVREE